MRVTKVESGRLLRRVGMGFLVALSLNGARVGAFPRPRHEDADVVARSELIVVARMEEGSIRKEDFRTEPGGGPAYRHHATLIVTEVLKGSLKEKRIPILIHYGLFPIVGGDARPAGTTRNIHEHPEDYPEGNIEIGDMSMLSFFPLPVKDAREDNLWFLRRRSGYHGQEPGHGDYGIVDPEDFQPIALKKYFLAYLSDDPERAVRRVMEEDAEVVERGRRFLDRQEVRRILKMDDPRTRADRLVPFLVRGLASPHFFEVRHGIVACGRTAGPLLWPVYRDPKVSSWLKGEVISMWGEIGYRDCVPELIALLDEHERFWASQDLEADWWNRDVRGTGTGRRRVVWGEDFRAVRALGQIGDHRARHAVETSRRRWAAIPFEPRDQIVQACDEALKSL